MWYPIIGLVLFLIGAIVTAVYAAYNVANNKLFINQSFWESTAAIGLLLFVSCLIWVVALPIAIIGGIVYLIFQFALSFFKEKEKHKSWQ